MDDHDGDTTVAAEAARIHETTKKEVNTFEPNFDIPGVSKIVISPLAQKDVGIVVGEHVTVEKPWKKVEKEVLQDNLELREESSEFLQLKDDILKFPKDDLLLGYIPVEDSEHDEFYICLTEQAENEVTDMITKVQTYQETKLDSIINRKIKRWITRGSGPEVDQNIKKNNRPLLEVEVESAYPIFPIKPRFKLRPVEAARDGYMELLPGKYAFNNINKRRIDGFVQVTPSVRPNEAQTVYTYPKNIKTQYEYKYSEVTEDTLMENIETFVFEKTGEFSNILRINSFINLYKNDYLDLITDVRYTKTPSITLIKEYMSFFDNNKCQSKMISSAAWHPMWTGVAAIAYVDLAPNTFIKCPAKVDEVLRAVYGINPVLIFSFKDGLNPQLTLEAHREVMSLSFCPYDENILIGGCANGQIIIWNISNKLKDVEEKQNITSTQQNSKLLMYHLMKWTKKIDLSLVRPTAVSDIKHSHRGSVTGISWLPLHWEVTKSGQVQEICEERTNTSMQFLTCSADGSILFWNVLSTSTNQPGHIESQRKLKRLKQRPSALMVDVLPFKIVHRNLEPHFKITVSPAKENRLLSLSAMSISSPNVEYIAVNSDVNRKFDIDDRIIFKPLIHKPKIPPKREIAVGTTDGDLMVIAWEGYEYVTEETESVQRAKIIKIQKYHDGPIVWITRCPFIEDVLITVGGRIVAIWNTEFCNRPIYWRSAPDLRTYTHGVWSIQTPTKFRLARSDGNIEVWHLLIRSDKYVQEQIVSGQALTLTQTHPKTLKETVIGIADCRGCFRMFYSNINPENNGTVSEVTFMSNLIKREGERQKKLEEWQIYWCEKNAFIVQKKQQAELRKQKEVEDAKKAKQKEEMERQKLAKEAAKRAAESAKPPPGKYLEWSYMQRVKKENERMSQILLAKKHLDKQLMEKQQLPLKMLASELESKKQKQEERLGNAKQIFDDSLATLFPSVTEKKPPSPVNPYKATFSVQEKELCYEEFNNIKEKATEFIERNHYKHLYNWSVTLSEGREQRKSLDGVFEKRNHKRRHELVKLKRIETEEEEKEKIKRMATYVPVPQKHTRLSKIVSGLIGDHKKEVLEEKSSQNM